MISHSIIKRPVNHPPVIQTYSNEPIVRLTQIEFDKYIESGGFAPGDLIYYYGRQEPFVKLEKHYQINYVRALELDATKVDYDSWDQVPKYLQVTNIGNHYTNPTWQLHMRWETLVGWKCLNKDNYRELIDDRVQDYLKANGFSWNIPSD